MKAKKEKASLTIREFFKMFPSDEACLEHLFEARFGQGHVCSRCERKASWYRIKAERAYSCQWCGNHLHPTVGTPFEDSRTALQLWFYAIYLFTTSRHGVPAKELERQLGVTYKTAWRMADMIRKHMSNVDGEDPLFGEVVPPDRAIPKHRAFFRWSLFDRSCGVKIWKLPRRADHRGCARPGANPISLEAQRPNQVGGPE